MHIRLISIHSALPQNYKGLIIIFILVITSTFGCRFESMKYVFTLLLIAFICSCSKKNASSPINPIVGAWTFSYATSNNSPIFNNDSDSIYIVFDNANRYVYKQFKFPVDQGNYRILNDSEIIFTSDTTTSSFFAYTHFLGIGMPFTDAEYESQFSTDKYFFSKTNTNQLIIKRIWSLTSQPNKPPGDMSFYFRPR